MCFSKANTCLAKCLSLLFAMLVINCGGRDMERQHGHEYDAVQRISSMMSEGRYMQVLSITDTLLGLPDVSGDVKGTALGYKALAYIMTNMLDSADIYITELEEILDNDTGFHHNALIGYTARGIYAIKKELDYSKAMSCFYEAMEIAEMRRDTLNQVVSLCNLVNVCQLRKDTSGLRYAQTAYSLSRSKKNPYIITSSALCLSDMFLLAGMYSEALQYADTAGVYMDVSQLKHRCWQVLNRAQALSAMDRISEAEVLFEEVKTMIPQNGVDMEVKYRMTYGKHLLARNRSLQAIMEFESALKSMGDTHEDKALVYLLLSDAYSKAGEDKRSLEYYKHYHSYCDSLAVHEKELQLNKMIRDMERIKYDKEIAERELEVVKANRNTLISVGAALACCVVAAVFWIMLRKTNHLYRTLVEQHQQYMQKQNRLVERSMELTAPDSEEDVKDKALFERLEQMMKDGKSYRMKDISLNKLAEMLSSNRAYVSKVINRFADQTFSSYINSKRINEAIAVLSDPDDDTPLKMLSDELGYNTLSTFYRAFVKETGVPPSKYRSGLRHLRKEE